MACCADTLFPVPHTFLTHNAYKSRLVKYILISSRVDCYTCLSIYHQSGTWFLPHPHNKSGWSVTITEPAPSGSRSLKHFSVFLLSLDGPAFLFFLFLFFFLFLSLNQPVLFGNLCISPIKQGGAWWLLIRSSVGPEQHSWGCAGSLLERNAAETKAESQTALIRKNNTFFFLFFFLKWGTMWERGCDSAGCQYWELTTQSLPSASFQSWPQKYRITNDLVPSRQNYNTQTNFTLYIFFATSGGD